MNIQIIVNKFSPTLNTMSHQIELNLRCRFSKSIFSFGEHTLKGALLGLRQFLATERSLKMMGDAFYFTLKVLAFCTNFLVMQKSSLIRKIKLISKFMMSQPGQQTIAIHILPKYFKSKGNETIKFGQLIE